MIRPYSSTDTETVLRVWYDASVAAHDFVPAEFWQKERADVRYRYLPAAETWVYEHEGEVVAFISLLGDFIGGLFVAPAHQGRGIGHQLIEHATHLRANLLLDVFAQNERARRFYEKCGFVTIKSGIHTPTGCPQITMQLQRHTTE